MVTTLSAREAEIFEIVYEHGHSWKQAAEWLGIEPQTVKTYALRLRRKLRSAGTPLPDKRRRFSLTHPAASRTARSRPIRPREPED